MRGEYVCLVIATGWCVELPPHARRIHPNYPGVPCWGNYLRVRGEYMTAVQAVGPAEELPPRTRRIQSTDSATTVAPGTTSACAENTAAKNSTFRTRRNYLRVRGEYLCKRDAISSIAELPPRARRIRFTLHLLTDLAGTTSACAENTCCGSGHPCGRRNYLRVRGEYLPRRFLKRLSGELPPRARRIHFRLGNQHTAHGTTSACAENTGVSGRCSLRNRNYLRVRGEYGHPRSENCF